MKPDPVHLAIHVFSLTPSASAGPWWLPYGLCGVLGVLIVAYLYGYKRITGRPIPTMLYQTFIFGGAIASVIVCAILRAV